MIALALLAPLLAGQTIGSVSPSLLKRDDSKSNAFAPGTTEGCPAGWPTCGSSGICYNPDEGATCCPGGTYACPSSTFCLLDPYCCPDDLTPESCAKEYGLTLVPTSPPSESTTFPLPKPSNSESESDSGGHHRPTAHPTSSDSANSSITLSPTPIRTSSVVLWPSLSVIPTGSPSAGQEPAYTGTGWSWRVRGGELATIAGAGALAIGVLCWV
ncbi:uncharacterized protein BDW70DRAFT_81702 [Aspergillus foveolatus]|uniref:uncharacterized protein n=1 Tax=Aspergillus foveolatus TaxID=210207 RepID=UPI003CCCDA5A